MSSGFIRVRLNSIYNLESSARLRSFEGLRAWAVIMVFNVHFFGMYYLQHYFVQADSLAEGAIKFLHAGHVGVDLFFVLSGFLIFSTLNRNKPSFGSYIKHRLSRIMPAHVAVLLILLVLLFPAITWGNAVGNVFFMPSFFPSFANYNNVTWTLGWEWSFYILMFCIFLLRGNSSRGLYIGMIGTLIVLWGITFFFAEEYRWGELIRGGSVILPEPGRFAGFFIGVAAAHLLTLDGWKTAVHGTSRTMLPMAIIGVILSQVVWSIHAQQISDSYALRNLYYLAVSACFGVIVTYLAARATGGLLNRTLQSSPMRIIGQISFSFYLIHAFVIRATAGEVNSFQAMCLHYATGFLLTIILATLMYYYLERPYFLSKKN